MKLIEDLGRLPVGTQNQKTRFGIYECPVCSMRFKCATPHVTSGHTTKCSRCRDLNSAKKKIEKSKSTLEERLLLVHGETIKVDIEGFINVDTPIRTSCICGNTWYPTPANLLRNRGCPCCSFSGFDRSKPGILYYLLINDKYFKIGITNRSVQERFRKVDLVKIQVLNQWFFKDGRECYNTEQLFHKAFKEFRYAGEPLLESGNTEIYTIDILCQKP